jgi:hypothetical protein
MTIKQISGVCLTATNKKHIKALLHEGLSSGKIGRISYFLKKYEDVIYITFKQMDRGLGFVGEKIRESTYKSCIQILP